MGRYINDLISTKDVEAIEFIAEDFFEKVGFKKTVIENEEVWKKGVGLLTNPQFIKLECRDNQVHIEAWLKFPIIPGVYVGEMGIKGFFALIPKQLLKDNITKLENLIK